jgi:hypothetical protein
MPTDKQIQIAVHNLRNNAAHADRAGNHPHYEALHAVVDHLLNPHECSHATGPGDEPCDLVAGLTAELEEIKQATLHESWETASKKKMWDGLRFQGAVSRAALERNDELVGELEEVKGVLRDVLTWIDSDVLKRIASSAEIHGLGITADEARDGHAAVKKARNHV